MNQKIIEFLIKLLMVLCFILVALHFIFGIQQAKMFKIGTIEFQSASGFEQTDDGQWIFIDADDHHQNNSGELEEDD